MKTTGRVNGIISNIVIVKADGAVGQNEICYVYAGDTKMMAEVIKVVGDSAYVQVFDSTRGLKIGDKVEFEGHMLEVTLAPGLLSRNYDGLQNDLEKMDGLFIERGSDRLRRRVGIRSAGQGGRQGDRCVVAGRSQGAVGEP